MKREPKLRGGSSSEITKLKKLWRDTFSEPQREYLRSLFASEQTQAQIRSEIFTKHGINLLYDMQLTNFREWEFDQRKMDLEAERMAEDEQRLIEQHGSEWTLDTIRDEVLRRSYARSLATGDFKQGLATVDRDLAANSGKLEVEKFKIKQDAEARMREKLALERQKFMHQMVIKALDAETQKRVKEIAGMKISHTEQIEMLGAAMFGEDWQSA